MYSSETNVLGVIHSPTNLCNPPRFNMAYSPELTLSSISAIITNMSTPSSSISEQIAADLTSQISSGLPSAPGASIATAIITAVAAQVVNQIAIVVATQITSQVYPFIASQIINQLENNSLAATSDQISALVINKLPALIAAAVTSQVVNQTANSVATDLTVNIASQLGLQITAALVALDYFTSTPPGPPFSQPLLSAQTLGTLRNNWTGPVGFSFICATNSTCVAVGRWVVSGNAQSHIGAIVSAAGVVLGYGTITTFGASPGTYAYATLNVPVSLIAGQIYYVVSQESYGGDQWYDFDTAITPVSEGTAITPVYASGTLISSISGWTVPNHPGFSYGPVNMLFTEP